MVCESQDFPIEELMDFLFDGKGNGYLAVLIEAMIDDSADRDREKVIVSGALIGAREQWCTLKRKWKERLDQDEIQYYKDYQCRHLRGQFQKYRSEKYPAPLGREIADNVRTDLEKIIRECDILGVGCIIPIPLWRKFKADPIYQALASTDPYHWAVQTVWTLSADVVRQLGKKNILAFAHDEDNNFSVLYDLYRKYKKKNRNDRKIMTGFVPLDDEKNPPIQAADVAASVTYQLAMKWVDNPGKATLNRLMESMYQIKVWDDDSARIVLDSEIKKRPPRTKAAI